MRSADRANHWRPIIAVLVLAACSPDEEEVEKACFDKLKADFYEYSDLVKQAAEGKSLQEQSKAREHALIAIDSTLTIAVIWTDDDRSACDYVSAGPYLQRK